MSLNLLAECERAKFLDWIENNKTALMDFLILEHEETLREIYDEGYLDN